MLWECHVNVMSMSCECHVLYLKEIATLMTSALIYSASLQQHRQRRRGLNCLKHIKHSDLHVFLLYCLTNQMRQNASKRVFRYILRVAAVSLCA